jgi:ABC-type bacteriocin/lantibiotic exporter with double-glycine peptidase domain
MRVLRYLFGVIFYSAKSSPITAYAVLGLAVIGTLLEFAALSVLIPLGKQVSHGASSIVSHFWVEILARLDVSPDIKTWFELFLVLIFVRVVLQLAYSVLVSKVSRDVTASLASAAFAKFVLDTPLLEIQRHKVGHFIAIAGDEASRAGQIFLYFCQLLTSLLSVLVTLAAMLVFSAKLALAVGLFIVVTGVVILQSVRRIYYLGGVIKTESRIATSTFLDGLNGLRSVRSIGGETYVVRQYADQVRKYHQTIFRVDFTSHAQKSTPLIILLLLTLTAIVSQSSAGIARFDMTSAVASLILLIRFFPSAGSCLNNAMKLLSDLRAAHDVVSIATAPAPSVPQKGLASGGSIHTIELSALCYRYDADAPPVLENLSYSFRAGCSYAICGASGSGKSTLVDLMVGLIPEQNKGILINGVPIGDLDLQCLRRRVVLVEQQSRIFNDTVRNNVVFGIDASDAEVLEAIELAGFGEVVNALPLGLQTMLDYQGANLSGGQRQRLGIARAILRNPSVLILDESLSALDTIARNRVLENILRVFSDRIVIIVTHDAAVASRMQFKLTLPAPKPRGSPTSSPDLAPGLGDDAAVESFDIAAALDQNEGT